MSVETRTVSTDEAELRLDRWFRRHFPALGHGRLEKLLRTGQVRVDGRRAKAGQRLEPGQQVRVPPLGPTPTEEAPRRPPAPADAKAIAALQRAVLHKDDEVLAVDKPPGLAVQGGSGQTVHLDAMLDGLRFGAPERPRLVHRLDKDTSGVLLLARSAAAARWLTAAFRQRSTAKTYWAVVVGVPQPREGRVDAPLAKLPGRAGEKVAIDEDEGKRAVTDYRVAETAGKRAAWVVLEPVTGRTHQLRAHMAALGTPILGDGKYGGAEAMLSGDGVSRKLHLHARSIELVRPDGRRLRVTAPLPPHIAATWRFFGFAAEPGS